MNIVKANQKFGQGVLAAAQEEVNEQRKKAAIGQVQQIILARDAAKISRDWCKRCIDFFEEKLTAIEKGQFSYDARTNVFRFFDEQFNATQPKQGD